MATPTRRAHPARWKLFQARGTVKGLAAATSLTRSHVSNILNGRATASPEFRRAVADYLGAPEDELFHPDEFR